MKILFLSRSTLYTQTGGDTLHLEQTALQLRKLGYEIDIKLANDSVDYKNYDLIHFFNLNRPSDVLAALKKEMPPIILSSIYIDYAQVDQMRSGLSKVLYQVFGAFGFEYIKVFARWVKGKEKFPSWKYAFLGQKKSMRRLLSHASAILTASEHEQQKIEADFQLKLTNSYVVHLGSEHISPSETKSQNRKGGICVARIERLKNQLNLIKAFNSLNENLKIVGQAAAHQKDYWEVCKQQAQTNIQFLGYLSGEDLKNQFNSSKVHILPSYYETTGLATIEALKLGCQAVVSDQGTQRELFSEHVFYCDPNQPESIAQAVQEAMQNEHNHSDWVKENFSWVKAAHQISDIYRTISHNT